jgi:hypothetical protein
MLLINLLDLCPGLADSARRLLTMKPAIWITEPQARHPNLRHVSPAIACLPELQRDDDSIIRSNQNGDFLHKIVFKTVMSGRAAKRTRRSKPIEGLRLNSVQSHSVENSDFVLPSRFSDE